MDFAGFAGDSSGPYSGAATGGESYSVDLSDTILPSLERPSGVK